MPNDKSRTIFGMPNKYFYNLGIARWKATDRDVKKPGLAGLRRNVSAYYLVIRRYFSIHIDGYMGLVLVDFRNALSQWVGYMVVESEECLAALQGRSQESKLAVCHKYFCKDFPRGRSRIDRRIPHVQNS